MKPYKVHKQDIKDGMHADPELRQRTISVTPRGKIIKVLAPTKLGNGRWKLIADFRHPDYDRPATEDEAAELPRFLDLNNKVSSEEDSKTLDFHHDVALGKKKAESVDWRPTETIPEDYYSYARDYTEALQ